MNKCRYVFFAFVFVFWSVSWCGVLMGSFFSFMFFLFICFCYYALCIYRTKCVQGRIGANDNVERKINWIFSFNFCFFLRCSYLALSLNEYRVHNESVFRMRSTFSFIGRFAVSRRHDIRFNLQQQKKEEIIEI